MRNIKIVLSIIMLFILILPYSVLSFDKTVPEFVLPENPGLSYVKIITVGTAIGLSIGWNDNIRRRSDNNPRWKQVYTSFMMRGVGFVISDKYVVTAAHVISPVIVSSKISQNFIHRDSPIKVLNTIIIVSDNSELNGSIPADIYYCNKTHDVAILELKETTFFKPITYQMVRTQERLGFPVIPELHSLLGENDSLMLIARKRDNYGNWTSEFEIRTGKVLSSEVLLRRKEMLSENHFTAELDLFPGDSGSPVFAFKNGIPVIVGIASAIEQYPSISRRTYITRIDFIKKVVESVLY